MLTRVAERIVAHAPGAGVRRRAGGAPPRLRRHLPLLGHMAEFALNPMALLRRAVAQGGEVVEIDLLGQDVVLLTGPEAHEAFFRAPDDQLCRREAYKLMTPIFGEGVVFDAKGKRLDEQMKMVMGMLRDKRMRRYPPVLVDETRKELAGWGASGEVDLLGFRKELTLYTSSRCLVGDEFRGGMDAEFRRLYGDLEKGITPLAYLHPHLPLPSFRRRDAARRELVGRVERIVEGRQAAGDNPDDGMQLLLESTYKSGERLTPHEITGILIALMLAGHHTSAGTITWVLVELLRHPEHLARVQAEVDAAWASEGGETLSYDAIRQMPYLHLVAQEVLRLHPPLIFLFRKVLRDFEYGGYRIEAGKMLCASPGVAHRQESTFPHPDGFDPERFARGEADNPFAFISFGGGKHKCAGNAFGLLQLKALVATVLRDHELRLVDPPSSYRDDYNQATVMPVGPVRITHRKRTPPKVAVPVPVETPTRPTLQLDPAQPVRVRIDRQLCVGHAVCVSEAPKIFRLAESGEAELIEAHPPAEQYALLARAAEHCPNQAIVVEQGDERCPFH
ncbi:MAG: cytochrome P450 [Myxococcales bacterium]|nr:cytochrome P450 [Myxococcales bacterium]